MKMAELLRSIADIIDQNSTVDQSTTLTPVDTPTVDKEENPVMIPPLQAKLEILKKSEGLPNVYGDEDSSLFTLKKNAGITTAQQEASDDEPLDL
jgi:hypothetical protein